MTTSPTPAAHLAWTTDRVSADDGWSLAVRRCTPTDGAPRGHLVVASATGVPQGFYRRFAERAAARGYAVTTFDYRGIGDSAPASLRNLRMHLLDWARLDLAAVLADTHARASREGRSVLLVGHSFGGHTLGLLPRPDLLAGAFFLGSGSGWTGWMPRAEQLRVHAMWRVVGPWTVRRHGYLAWSRFGMGEDLPVDAYRQWRHWCGFPGYFFDDPEVADELRAAFAALDLPVVYLSATDDRWASPRSRDAFVAHYRPGVVETRDVTPASIGRPTIGHLGYFREDAAPLWEDVLDWCDARAAAVTR